MKSKNKWLIIVLAVVLAMVLVVGKVIGWRNHLVQLDENVKQGWAQVETQLQRRVDLIPNLVATVKGYAAHEENVLTEVTQARASVGGAKTPQEQIEANNQLTGALSRLLVVVEKYPDLKANQNFIALQDELAGTENRISVARQRYNEIAQTLNSTIRKFPYSMLASGFEKAPYFKASTDAQKAPEVKF